MLDFQFYDTNRHTTIQVHIKTEKGVDFNHLPVQKPDLEENPLSENEKNENEALRLVLKRVVADAFKSFKYGDNKKKELDITITKIDSSENQISYRIEGQKIDAIRQINLTGFDTTAAIKEIVDHRIVSIEKMGKEVGVQSLLHRFSKEEPMPQGFFAKMQWIEAKFFKIIHDRFTFIDTLWKGIKKQSATELKWDLAVLAEVCGQPPTERVSLHDSLKYLHSVMKRERGMGSDPALKECLEGAVKTSSRLIALRKKFSAKALEKNAKVLAMKIDKLAPGEKILLPVGYYNYGDLTEMLLEVEKQKDGKCNVTLISAAKEVGEYFDHQTSGKEGVKSIRREMSNVGVKDIQARLPLLLELATSPGSFEKSTKRNFSDEFFETLKFPDSVIGVSIPTEKVTPSNVTGHMREVIAYLDQSQLHTEESQRFDLALRLRLFLDICHTNKKSWIDPDFRTAVRTTTYQLAKEIEENKTLLGSHDAQGVELARIYRELQNILETLETHPPKVADLRGQKLALISGKIKLESQPEAPMVTLIKMDATSKNDVDPPFELLNKTEPMKTLNSLKLRFERLEGSRLYERASDEAILITRMFPPITDDLWKNLKEENREDFYKFLLSAAHGLTKNIEVQGDATLEEMMAMATLNYYGYYVELLIMKDRAVITNPQPIADFVDALSKCHISGADRMRLMNLKEAKIRQSQTFNNNNQSLKSLAQSLKDVSEMNKKMHKETPLFLQHPEYAEITSQEITNRYVTQQCPLGCTCDNCSNYAQIEKKQHRFHPLYMLHNFVDIFAENGIHKGLARDEAVDLLYTQTTLQKAKELFDQMHQGNHGTRFAHGFDKDDSKIQIMLTWMVFMQHPDFFKSPELRWHFETKLFTTDSFSDLLKPEQLPFVHNMLKQLKKEIKIAHHTTDIEKCVYLTDIQNQLRDIIVESSVNKKEKESLISLLLPDTDKLLHGLFRDFLSDEENQTEEKQRMVSTIALNTYFEKFCKHPYDPVFNAQEDLVTVVVMNQRLQNLKGGMDKVDPQLRARIHILLTFVEQNVKKQCESAGQENQFVNSVLMLTNPLVAKENISWSVKSFPILTGVSHGKNYAFNISTGKVSIDAVGADVLPREFTKHPDLIRLFGGSLKENWTMLVAPKGRYPDETAIYMHKDFPQYRILQQKTASGATKVVAERLLKNPMGKEEWVSYVRFREQDQLIKGSEIENGGNLPAQVTAAIGDRDCWVDKKKQYIYVMEGKGDKPYAVIDLKTENGGGSTEDRIVDMLFTDNDTHLLNPEKRAVERFLTIESSQFLQVKGKNQKASHVEYLRYSLEGSGAKLQYKIDKNQVSSVTFPGYRLAKYGSRPGRKDSGFSVKPLPDTFDGYQLLQKEGQEKVLIPMRSFEQQFDVNGKSLPYSKTQFPDGFSTCPLFEYRVDADSNRLITDSADGYAYLAYVCMTHGDYGSSRFYLDKARTSTGYTPSVDQILEWLDEWQDTSSNGIATRLHFALFTEKVMEDRRNDYMARGELKNLGEVDFKRIPHLIAIAQDYESYMQTSIQKDLDPSLALAPGEHVQSQKLLRELLGRCGNDVIETREITPVRAIHAPLEKYLHKEVTDNKDRLGYHKGTTLLWAQRVGEKGMSPVTVKDPLWIVQNFREIFNKILQSDINSTEVKQLILQVEMVSHMSKIDLDIINRESVEIAQSYILKLVTCKRKNATVYDQIPRFLSNHGYHNQIPQFKGPWSIENRNKKIELANTEYYEFYDPTITDKGAAEKKFTDHFKDWKYYNESNRLDDIESFFKKFKGSPEEFHQEYRFALLKAYYGSGAAKSIDILDQIFSILEPFSISGSEQTLKQTHQIPPPNTQTYKDRYEKLLTVHVPATSSEEITALEKEIFTGIEPSPPPRVVTDPDKLSLVLGDLVAKCTDTSIINIETLEPVTISREVFDNLKKSDEPAVVRSAKEHEQDLNAALTQMKSVSIDRKGIKKIIGLLENASKESENNEEILRRNLMQFIERFDTPAGILAMRRLTGKSIKPNLDTIIALWRREEINRNWDANVFKEIGLKQMTPEVLKELDVMIHDYLKADTQDRHLHSTLTLAKDYQKSCGSKDENVGDKALAKELYDALNAKRFYLDSDSDVRDLLFMEYSQKIILRKGQVDTFREMASAPNAVRQLEMGGGKSKVLNPLLAKHKANGQNLVMLVLPEELYETNCRDLDATNRMLFGQEMHRFEFSRSSESNLEALEIQHLRLLKTIQEQGFVMATKRSMLSFRNAYAEKLCNLKNFGPYPSPQKAQAIAEVREMSRILALFRDHTDVIADEVDACLDIRKEVNFSLGEGKPISPIKRDVGVRMIETILKAKPNSHLARVKEELVGNMQGSMSQEDIDNCMKEIAKVFFSEHKLTFPEQEFIDYLMDKSEGKNVENEVNTLKETDLNLYYQITALKGFIHQGFGSTFKRVGKVNYGRDPISETWTIPYKASNTPNMGSEFDDDIERISFSIQDHLQFGVNFRQVFRSISQLHHKAVQELRALREDEECLKGFNDTEAAKEFESLLKKIDPQGRLGVNLTLSAMMTPARIEALVSTINASLEGRLAFVENCVLNQMKQTETQINAVSSDLPEMVRGFAGFSGTPWNLHSFHDKIDGKKNLGVDGRTWALMLSRDVEIKTFDLNLQNPVESMLSNLDILSHSQAVIDTGAYLRGVSNETFVNAAMKHAKEDGSHLEGCIYFNDSGRIVKKTSLDSEALPIESAEKTDSMKTLTLYDQAHTVGADIKQGKNAIAIVTIGENTFIRDLFQAVWRLRQLDKEQKFVLAVSDKIKEKILGSKDQPLKMDDILQFCLSNESKREAEDNFRAEKGKIMGTAKQAALNTSIDLINNGLDNDKMVNLSEILASEKGLLLKARAGEEAFDGYGALKSQESPKDQLDRLKKAEADLCKKLAGKLGKIDKESSGKLENLGTEIKERKIPPLDWMPKKVSTSQDSGVREVELEAQAEVQVEVEVAIENLSEQQTQNEKESIIPMVASGQAGSGEVKSITDETLSSFADNMISDKKIRAVKNVCSFFDERIFCTEVFERNLPISSVHNACPQLLFYTTRKTPNEALIFKDNNGKFAMVIPTVHEAHDACRKFIAKNKLTGAVVGITPAEPLIFYKSGDDRTEKSPFADEAERKEFYRLYVQLKLFNGEIEFSTIEEKEALTLWLKEKGVKEFREYFEKNILSTKPRRFANAYQTSSLNKLFNTLQST